jgi:hypothetical protein
MIKGFGNIFYLFEMETEILCSSVYNYEINNSAKNYIQ